MTRLEGRASGRRWTWLVLAVLAALAPPRVDAAAISVSASVESTDVAVGEPFLLTILVDGAQNVPVPVVQVKGFRADYIGPSTQVSFVNGKMSASVAHRYRMIADDEGQFTLGPFTVGYEDERYQTKPITMKVHAGGARAQGAGPSSVPGGEQGLRLIVRPARSEIYVGEPVDVTLTLYVGDVPVRELYPPTMSADGATLDKFGEATRGSEVLDGRRYTTVRMQAPLTPIRPGTIDVRASMKVGVMTRRRGLDSIFDQLLPGDSRQVEIQSDPVSLTVLPLPAEGRPADFAGTVGQYQFELTAKPTSLQVGDPITLHMEISGSGNLAAVTPPQIPAGPSFRRYDAQPVKGEDGDQRRVFEQVIIPNSVDVHEIPALSFSFFDPDARTYRTITRGPTPIQVAAAAPGRAAVVEAVSPVAPTPVAEAPLGRDIVYIKDAPGTFHALGARTPRGGWLGILALPVLGFVGLSAWVRRRDRLAGDPRLVRFRAAGREAQRALAAARGRAGRERDDAISAALTAYLAAKLDLPPGAIERDRVLQRLAAAGVADGTQAEVTRFFALAEETRYAAGAAGGGAAEAAERIVAALERERGLERRLGALVVVLLSAAVLAVGARADEPAQSAFFQGNQAYAAGRYDDAIAAYEQARASGQESGALAFNLGNAYLKRGDIGHAIANYERAARELPRDPDVTANLAFARERANIEAPSAPIWQRLAAPFAFRASSGELLAVFAVLWWLFWGLLAARLLVPRARTPLGRAAAATMALAAIVGVSLVVRVSAVDVPGAAVVVAAGDTPVRFEPTDKGTEHFVVTPGVDVSVREERDGWLLVARADGRRGWIPAAAVERVD